MLKQYLEVGKIVGTHGIRGEMRVQPWCDSPEFMTEFDSFYTDDKGQGCLRVIGCRVHGNVVLLRVDGVCDIPSAESYRGRVIYIDRNDVRLDEGAHFVQDLIGCEVLDERDGHCYGKITDVSRTGANDVWHIGTDDGERLIPVIPDVVKGVDVEQGRVIILPIAGLFDED